MQGDDGHKKVIGPMPTLFVGVGRVRPGDAGGVFAPGAEPDRPHPRPVWPGAGGLPG